MDNKNDNISTESNIRKMNDVFNDFFGASGDIKNVQDAVSEMSKSLNVNLESLNAEIKELEKRRPIPGVQDLTGQSTAAKNSDSAKETKETEPEPEEKSEEKFNALMDELNGLVGLANVKEDVKSLMNFIKVNKVREERGMKVPTVSYHLVFTGNPGTGKTTVARLVAKLYYQMGILSKGQLIETDRSSLVAGFVGQTAIKTQEVIKKAMGGVLFIDEAYSLYNDDQDSYGKESIETILKAMEDHRDELIVIVAGYTDLMHRFIDSNPGLSSRFNKYFEFPDYEGDELVKIFERQCSQNGYSIDDETKKMITEKFNELYENRNVNFGNARTIRNIFEKAINIQANRLAEMKDLKDEDLEKLTMEDIKEAMKEQPGKEAIELKFPKNNKANEN